ncbi:MAG: hypothetical protein U0V49_12190 [Saprospiraceae bacterium]
MILRYFATVFLILVISDVLKGQGCSDAGICQLEGLSQRSGYRSYELQSEARIGAAIGKADHGIAVYNAFLEYNRKINNQFKVELRFTMLAQHGIGISASGLSDFYLNGIWKLWKGGGINFGMKLPLSNGNRKLNGVSLPMDFQSSLGTLDGFIGIHHQAGKLTLSSALQYPLTQNKNQFFASQYPTSSELSSFQSTPGFERSPDWLGRISYSFEIGSSLQLIPGLLTIYHLANDRYVDLSGVRRSIDGSSGVTANINLSAVLQIGNQGQIVLQSGIPMLVRKSRPDGLTRSFVAGLEYRAMF